MKHRWFFRVINSRAPDFIIGTADDPYMRRWWLIPRNPIFNVYLHQFWRSDEDRALHDHPWPSLSILLHGTYREWIFSKPELGPVGGITCRDRQAGDWIWRCASQAHRIELRGMPRTCITLFMTGPHLRAWGFHFPNGWVPWQLFTAPHDKGQIGRGCE